jgi:hypothetical protein
MSVQALRLRRRPRIHPGGEIRDEGLTLVRSVKNLGRPKIHTVAPGLASASTG